MRCVPISDTKPSDAPSLDFSFSYISGSFVQLPMAYRGTSQSDSTIQPVYVSTQWSRNRKCRIASSSIRGLTNDCIRTMGCQIAEVHCTVLSMENQPYRPFTIRTSSHIITRDIEQRSMRTHQELGVMESEYSQIQWYIRHRISIGYRIRNRNRATYSVRTKARLRNGDE